MGRRILVDVKDFRTEDKDYLLRQIYEMTRVRCQLIRRMITDKPWDFFMFVEMGVDRIHHGMWSYTDEGHWRFEPGNKHINAIRDYYIYLDREIGEMLALLPEDTVVMVASDHGAKRMDGGLAINEWLRREGYLTLAQDVPDKMTPFEHMKSMDQDPSVEFGRLLRAHLHERARSRTQRRDRAP